MAQVCPVLLAASVAGSIGPQVAAALVRKARLVRPLQATPYLTEKTSRT